MQEFIHRTNLENWRKLLSETVDEILRLRLQQLIADEEGLEPLPAPEPHVC